MPTVLRRIAQPLAVAVVIGLVASACSSGDRHARPGVYVALGDSYTAGPGITPVADAACGRSRANYPSLVAKALDVGTFTDRSCSGAVTQNLSQQQMVRALRVNGPQLSALSSRTTLVTVGIGLNDQGLSTGLLLYCNAGKAHGTGPVAPPSDTCRKYLDLPESAVDAQISRAADDLRTSLRKVEDAAPNAKIVLVGYPRLVADEGSCPDRLPVPDALMVRLRAAMASVNDAWHQVADEVGATYVDTYALSKGHDMCSGDPWINGNATALGKAAPLHPFEAYHQAVARAIVKALEGE